MSEQETYSTLAHDLNGELSEAEAIEAKIRQLVAQRDEHMQAAEELAERLRPALERAPGRTISLLFDRFGEPHMLQLWLDASGAIDYERRPLTFPSRLDAKFGAPAPATDEPPPDAPAHLHSNLCDRGCAAVAGETLVGAGAEAAEFGHNFRAGA